MDNTFSLFVSYLLPIHCSGLLLTFAVFFANEEFVEHIKKSLTPLLLSLIASTLIFTVCNEIFRPGAQQSLRKMEYYSNYSRDAMMKAQKAYEMEDYDTAKQEMGRYLSVIANDLEAEEFLKDISAKLSIQQAEIPEETVISSPVLPRFELTPSDLIRKAKQFAADNDHFSAYYYASIALRIDGDRLDAKRLVAESLEELSKMSMSPDDLILSELYKKKKEGITALTNDEPIKAYYIFKELMELYPRDLDVQKFFTKSSEEVVQISFFIDELEQLQELRGFEHIIFVNQKDTIKRELVSVRLLYDTPQGIYLRDVEIMAVSIGGELLYHLKSPYGKILGNTLMLQAIGRESTGHIEPTYIYGKENRQKQLRNLFQITPGKKYLKRYNFDTNVLGMFNIAQLFELTVPFMEAGFRSEPLLIELLSRIFTPFIFLILSVVSVALGCYLRRGSSQKLPVLFFLVAPALPFIMSILVNFYAHAHKVLMIFILLTTDFMVAIVLLVLIQSIFLFLSLLLLAKYIYAKH